MKLLIIVSRVPWPLDKGDKLRAYHQLRYLHQRHEIHLCCLNDKPVHPEAENELQQVCSKLTILQLSKARLYFNIFRAFFSSQPFQVKYFYQRPVHRKIQRLIEAFAPDHIYCQLVRAAEYVKNEHGIPKTLDYMDALSKNMERRSQQAPWWQRPMLKAEVRRMVAYENIIFEYFEGKTIISDQDRNLIYHPQRAQIAVVPNGVDTSYFHPIERPNKYDLVFTGNMGYPPNVESAIYLAREVMPLILKSRPDTRLLISGTDPAASVKALADQNTTVSGRVDDIRESYAAAHIFIAPIHLGTGLQNKLLEAMAMKIACITSPMANNALGAKDGESIVIGQSPEEYCERVLTLLNDKAARAVLAENGYSFVKENYSWESANRQLEMVLQSDGPSPA